ncbi:MAG: DMT family transporter [Elusimicrobia bacterium]|nr:DMT family transporter [Elusimicrobiota bacterium]
MRARISRLLPVLSAALLFGAGTVLSKPFLSDVHPIMMAGMLYLSAGIGLAAWRLFKRSAEASIQRADLPRLSAAAIFGGLLGPILLMTGLARMPASSASLLLNFEAPLTALLAAALFNEHVGRPTVWGIALIAIGGAALTGLGPGNLGGARWAWIAVVAACLCWALDNNLTQRLSNRDPVQLAAVKGGVCGIVNVAAALALGAALPPLKLMGEIALIGLMSYGLSLVCYLISLRRIGTAKTAMYFALAPFIGASLAVVVLGERVTAPLLVAAAFMSAGAWLGAGEKHEHMHEHNEEHEHAHEHDEHHHHHAELIKGAHSHHHSHKGLVHTHPHEADTHHRHAH